MAKSNKKVYLWIALAVVLAVVACYIIFVYMPSVERTNAVNDYKKALLDSSLCQYNCPLTSQTIANLTQLIPNVSCVQACVVAFKNQTSIGDSFSNDDLKNDDLFKDFELNVVGCRKQSTFNNALNNSLYFECISGSIVALRQNYTYLN